MTKQKLIIGIDTGVNTGIAAWNVTTKKIQFIHSTKIHKALRLIESLVPYFDLFIRVEDARMRKWFGNDSNAKKQGAGSVKRDGKIWEDYLTDLKKQEMICDFKMIHPIKGTTKIDARQFKIITGHMGATNEHSRDAMMMVYQLQNI